MKKRVKVCREVFFSVTYCICTETIVVIVVSDVAVTLLTTFAFTDFSRTITAITVRKLLENLYHRDIDFISKLLTFVFVSLS